MTKRRILTAHRAASRIRPVNLSGPTTISPTTAIRMISQNPISNMDWARLRTGVDGGYSGFLGSVFFSYYLAVSPLPCFRLTFINSIFLRFLFGVGHGGSKAFNGAAQIRAQGA